MSRTSEWIPSPRRLRVLFAGEWVADSARPILLRQHGFLPVYYFPGGDVRRDLLRPSTHTTVSPYKGVASYWSVVVGERVAESAAWSYLEPRSGSPDTRGYYSFHWHAMDGWFEEDEEVFVHARDPFVRVDACRSARHVSVLVGDTLVAETYRPVLLFETELITRYYLPARDVRLDLLVPSETYSLCPYKGRARYHSLRVGDGILDDVAWSYPAPLPPLAAIANHLCFWNERDDATLLVDGEPVERLGIRESADGGELLYPSRVSFGVPPPASMRGAGPGERQHDFARPNRRAEGPPDHLIEMPVERAGGRPGSRLEDRSSFTFGTSGGIDTTEVS